MQTSHEFFDAIREHGNSNPALPPLRWLGHPSGKGDVLITPQTYDRLVELAK